MKRYPAVIFALLALAFPAMLFAQTDGGVLSTDPSTIVVAPQESAITPPPSLPVTQARPVSEPTPAIQPSPAPASAITAPAPAPSPTMMPSQAAVAPAPAPSPTANTVAPESAPPPAPISESTSLEDVQGAVEEIAEVAPESIQPVLAAVAGALGGIVFMFGLWEFLKRFKGKGKKPCDSCGGTGAKPADEKCALCGGTKKIEKEVEVTVACAHCKGSGTDPCHHCSGTGKMSLPNPPQSQEELEGWPPCDFCGGSGKKKVGAGRDWGEANDAMKGDFACCFCHGKKKETFKQKVQVDCPLCAKK